MNNRAMPPSEQTSPDSTTAIAPSGDRYSSSSPSICFNSIGLSSASDTFPVAAPTCCLHCNQYRQHLHLPCEDLLLRARRCCTRRFFFLPVVVAFPVLLPARGESDPDAFNLLHLESKSQTRSFIFFISNPNPKPDPIPEIPDPDAFNLWFCPGESEEGAASVLSFSQSKKLMINETLDSVSKLQKALIVADVYLSAHQKDEPWRTFEHKLKEWGFEKGWGDSAKRVKETMKMLSEILQAPDPSNMESFFSRLPVIFNIVIFSIHGYFGQSDVLGLPDTGGQVVYILDQVKALEEEILRFSIRLQKVEWF